MLTEIVYFKPQVIFTVIFKSKENEKQIQVYTNNNNILCPVNSDDQHYTFFLCHGFLNEPERWRKRKKKKETVMK